MAIDFLSGFAATQPRGVFSNFLAQQRKPVRDFFLPRFSELFNEFQGSLVKQTQLGQLPTQQFGDFLGGINLQNRLLTFSPQQRGDFSAQTLQPRTRSLHFL